MNSTENNNRAASHDFQTALGLLEERLRSLEDSEAIINSLLTYEWCAEGVEHQKDTLQYLTVSRGTELAKNLLQTAIVHMSEDRIASVQQLWERT